MTVTGVIRVKGDRVLGRVGGSVGDGKDFGFFRSTSQTFTRSTWVVFTTVTYGGTLGSCPYESGGNDGDPGF